MKQGVKHEKSMLIASLFPTLSFKVIKSCTFSVDSAASHPHFHSLLKFFGGWSQTTHKSDAVNLYRSKDNFSISNIRCCKFKEGPLVYNTFKFSFTKT